MTGPTRSTLEKLIRESLPGFELESVHRFRTDESLGGVDGTEKGLGYGEPLLLSVRSQSGESRSVVLHTARADAFGHDRRSDRAASMLLGFDRFRTIPRHVGALDVGALVGEKHVSLKDAGEFYLLTEFVPGRLYADELRAISARGSLTSTDRAHVDVLADLAAEIHAKKIHDPRRYRRSIRDLVGSGEGIFGMVDAYGVDVPAAPQSRLANIEARAERWRFRLRNKEHRLRRSHGDFHPFNILFDGDRPALLDTSRGSMGDPADDVTCLAINYLFFAVERPSIWAQTNRELWLRFWDEYIRRTGDHELFEVAAPFLAWRGLVVANPLWYPAVTEEARNRVLTFVERILEEDRFDPEIAEIVFR